jgi:hypothetical protein
MNYQQNLVLPSRIKERKVPQLRRGTGNLHEDMGTELSSPIRMYSMEANVLSCTWVMWLIINEFWIR